MKNTFLLIIAFFCITIGMAQDSTNISETAILDYNYADIKPEYPGGMTAFYNYLGNNFKVPDVNGLKGKIIANFVIDTDGTLTQIKIIRDIGYRTGREAVRVLENSKKWKPGMQNGKPVRVQFTIPITISY